MGCGAGNSTTELFYKLVSGYQRISHHLLNKSTTRKSVSLPTQTHLQYPLITLPATTLANGSQCFTPEGHGAPSNTASCTMPSEPDIEKSTKNITIIVLLSFMVQFRSFAVFVIILDNLKSHKSNQWSKNFFFFLYGLL